MEVTLWIITYVLHLFVMQRIHFKDWELDFQ